MPELAKNVRAGLDQELAGLEAKLKAVGKDGDAAVRARLERRISEVKDQQKNRAKEIAEAEAEKRPAAGDTEKRPG